MKRPSVKVHAADSSNWGNRGENAGNTQLVSSESPLPLMSACRKMGKRQQQHDVPATNHQRLSLLGVGEDTPRFRDVTCEPVTVGVEDVFNKAVTPTGALDFSPGAYASVLATEVPPYCSAADNEQKARRYSMFPYAFDNNSASAMASLSIDPAASGHDLAGTLSGNHLPAEREKLVQGSASPLHAYRFMLGDDDEVADDEGGENALAGKLYDQMSCGSSDGGDFGSGVNAVLRRRLSDPNCSVVLDCLNAEANDTHRQSIVDGDSFPRTMMRSFALAAHMRMSAFVPSDPPSRRVSSVCKHKQNFADSSKEPENRKRKSAPDALTGGPSKEGPFDAEECRARNNLDDDTVSFNAVFESIKSPQFTNSILYSIRCTLFVILPTLFLVQYDRTKAFFVAPGLVPVVAGLSVTERLGSQMHTFVISLQALVVFVIWGVIMNALGAVHNPSGWWCALIFGCFALSLLGDIESKRMMMVYVIIIMATEHVEGGDTLVFPLSFGKDFLIANLFSFLGCLLPFPKLSYRAADETLRTLHNLYAAAVGNAVKGFWAHVRVDGTTALQQVPYEQIRSVTECCRHHIRETMYEPIEMDLGNELRVMRLAFFSKVRRLIYTLTATASQKLEENSEYRHGMRKEVRDLDAKLREVSMALASEIISVLITLGSQLRPFDVVNNVHYDSMRQAVRTVFSSIEQARVDVMYLKELKVEEMNLFLRAFAVNHSLLDIATEIEDLLHNMKQFDASRYPSRWERVAKFFVTDLWNDFWSEVPKRLTLATSRDVRIWKDGVRLTLGFSVSAFFASTSSSDTVYYIGLAILIRLAQQTSSETLQIGIYRICGLVIGAAVAHISVTVASVAVSQATFMLTWVFVAMCFAEHPLFGHGAHYAVIICVTSFTNYGNSDIVYMRIIMNMLTVISYFLVCTLVFPLDPIRVLWNTRTKLFLTINDMTNQFVALGWAPIGMDGTEPKFILDRASALVVEQQHLLREYLYWMPKAEVEPTIRAGPYPVHPCAKVFLHLSQITSLQEALLGAFQRLHRPRGVEPSPIMVDIVHLLQPFLVDVGRIIRRYFQSMIDATELPHEWMLEAVLRLVWKSQLACQSLRHVTGNIQRNFFAAVEELVPIDKHALNMYVNSSFAGAALQNRESLEASVLTNPDAGELIQRVFAMSFNLVQDKLPSMEDMQAFTGIVCLFQLILETMGKLVLPMVDINAYERSRVSL